MFICTIIIIIIIFIHLSRAITFPTKLHAHPAKTQISLCGYAVWSESSHILEEQLSVSGETVYKSTG